jgi:hypothetical protein
MGFIYNYPVEKHILRFYKYKFFGFEDNPITIEAYNKLEARRKLSYFLQLYPQYSGIAVVSESLSLPIFGETTKEISGIKYVWCGELTPNCWMPLDEFLQLGYD